MRQYILKRLLILIPVLFGITILVFVIFKLAPGDPLSGVMEKGMTAERKAELRELMGLNRHPVIQYFSWLGKAVTGNLGESSFYKRSVNSVLGDFMWNSFYLSSISLILAFFLAIPLGTISATKQYSLTDSTMSVIALIGISIPSFFFSLLLINIFSVNLQWLPVSGMRTAGSKLTGIKDFLDVLKHMILPLTVLTFTSVASLMRYMRSSMLEVIRQDYIRTARAKGLKEKIVIYKHALRNAMIPMITIFGMSLGGLFAGAIITEQIFAWPGIGPVNLIAINNRDYNLMMGYTLLIAILTLLGNFLADICYAVVDPRIRFKK